MVSLNPPMKRWIIHCRGLTMAKNSYTRYTSGQIILIWTIAVTLLVILIDKIYCYHHYVISMAGTIFMVTDNASVIVIVKSIVIIIIIICVSCSKLSVSSASSFHSYDKKQVKYRYLIRSFTTCIIIVISLWWRHNDHDSVSNHQPHECLFNCLFRRRSKKTSKLRVTGLCVGNSPGPVNSPHKGPVTRKMFPFDDVIMTCGIRHYLRRSNSVSPNHLALMMVYGIADSKVHSANMGTIWGRRDPGGPHVGYMNFAIWDN